MTETSIPRAEQSLDEEETATLAVDGDDTEADDDGDDTEADDDGDGTEADDDGDGTGAADIGAAAGGRVKKAVGEGDLFRQSEIAADYVEGLLDILDYDGDIDELVAAGRPMVEVVGERLQNLVGQRGATLEALQELTRLAVFRQTGTPSRLLLDVGGYRTNRRKELAAVAKNAVEKVKEYGEPVRLDAMSAFERKCVHDVVNAMSGVESESEGVEPNRRIVVRPAD
ncbi:protein jag [Micromonospora sp. NBC_01638]|uniref:Jag family protein n=1 Tax=Micromonospora sp. NBC_01638 TaxID=2975982 RepID=UPI0038637258|nr:single-stranded DNA-binding protein [Micromonospora sp. NBC_01638]